MTRALDPHEALELATRIKGWGMALGFQQVGITDTGLQRAEQRLLDWLDAGHHGKMDYMARHGCRRARPAELVPGTLRIVSVRMDYHPEPHEDPATLSDPARAFVSRYALGRDYHKLIRRRLQRLADQITETIGPFGYRAFVDSAPVMEKPLAEQAGLGWIGKHTNLINPRAGSWFFLGELFTDLPLPLDTPLRSHCGHCSACLEVCPTAAIIAPYRLDARRCISYLTIEHPGPIPLALRPALGNRIYGCDDCQQVCPWNRFARATAETDFLPRQGLDRATLITLIGWDKPTFLERTSGSAIRRIGHGRWLRNLAVALGNADPSPATLTALIRWRDHPDPMVREHIDWALARQREHGARDGW
ncbi:tRNA epoxyqueuosine(34) reductase QueG [Marichromatium sp. AB32]|uniref:tRNA epoxyqueuosine(34) reductase QueG n=1 Tax=Marichromatium sp. AB32 TaxID=2483363 RepID=UPI000F3E69D9|nr:tRNA epoxyqueuosine(34) reductase QueG [Marichromatium sp. AB32]RNE94683.1 tRNA epoxyqueuosine(34) reductase QueG [Marichromatium sp. AB32]